MIAGIKVTEKEFVARLRKRFGKLFRHTHIIAYIYMSHCPSLLPTAFAQKNSDIPPLSRFATIRLPPTIGLSQPSSSPMACLPPSRSSWT